MTFKGYKCIQIFFNRGSAGASRPASTTSPASPRQLALPPRPRRPAAPRPRPPRRLRPLRCPAPRVRRGRPGPHSRRGEPVLLLLGGRAGAKALGPPDPPPATGDGPRASKAGPCRPPAPPGAGWEKRSSSVKT